MLVGEWMVPANQTESQRERSGSITENEKSKKKEAVSDEDKQSSKESTAELEMTPVYLKHLLPVFTQVYQRTMVTSIR